MKLTRTPPRLGKEAHFRVRRARSQLKKTPGFLLDTDSLSKLIGWHVSGQQASVFKDDGRCARDSDFMAELVLSGNRVRTIDVGNLLACLECRDGNIRIFRAPGGNDLLVGTRANASPWVCQVADLKTILMRLV